MNILFLCETNRFKSKVAEMLFKKYNSNGKFFAKSAGLHYGGYKLDKTMLETCKKMGIKFEGRPVKLNKELWNSFDLIITTSEDINLELTSEDKEMGKELVSWKIEELEGYGEEHIKKVVRQIAGKVRELVDVI